MNLPASQRVWDRVRRIEIPFNRYGLDPYGISQKHLATALTALTWMYESYLDMKSFGIENVPDQGRVMLVGNHSGGIALDGMMTIAALFLEKEPPRLAQGMAEYFLNRTPIASLWTSRMGHLTGLPEHAVRLLEDDRALMVFPEGARGTAKLYNQRNSLVRFGTGFMRIAMQAQAPIVPFAFVGGGDAIPTVHNSEFLGKLTGTPYVPFTPWLLPLPRPASCELYFGKPRIFEGDGSEADDIIGRNVDVVKRQIGALIDFGVQRRRVGDLSMPDLLPHIETDTEEGT